MKSTYASVEDQSEDAAPAKASSGLLKYALILFAVGVAAATAYHTWVGPLTGGIADGVALSHDSGPAARGSQLNAGSDVWLGNNQVESNRDQMETDTINGFLLDSTGQARAALSQELTCMNGVRGLCEDYVGPDKKFILGKCTTYEDVHAPFCLPYLCEFGPNVGSGLQLTRCEVLNPDQTPAKELGQDLFCAGTTRGTHREPGNPANCPANTCHCTKGEGTLGPAMWNNVADADACLVDGAEKCICDDSECPPSKYGPAAKCYCPTDSGGCHHCSY